MDFKYTVTDKTEYALLAISGSLIETHQADELMQQVEELLLHEKNKFVIDLGKLEFVNQAGVTILIKILTLARKNGGEVSIYNVSEELIKTHEGKKIQAVFSISENEFIAAALLV